MSKIILLTTTTILKRGRVFIQYASKNNLNIFFFENCEKVQVHERKGLERYLWGWVLNIGQWCWQRPFCSMVSTCSNRCPSRHGPFEICQSWVFDVGFLSEPENHKACARVTYRQKVITLRTESTWWESSTYLYLSDWTQHLEFWGLAARSTRALVYILMLISPSILLVRFQICYTKY